MNDISAGTKLARMGPIAVTGVLVLMLAVWVLDDPSTNLETDWTAFDRAADRFFAGETVYRPFSFEEEPLPYLYPPFVLWLSFPLALFGFLGSYAVAAVSTLIAYIAGLRWFARAEDGDVDRTTGLIVAICSGVAVGATLIGQYSGFYVLAFGAAVLLFKRDRLALAGLVLALLWIKPNVAIVAPVALVWARSWKTLGGFIAGSVALVLSSLPLGVGLWSGFLGNVQNMAELQEQGIVPIDKMVTVLSSVQTIFGLQDATTVSIAIWLAITTVLGVSILVLWTPDRLAESPVRAFGALALFAVAANPRLYFYDGALVAMGMFALWMNARVRGGELAKRWTQRLAWVVWFGTWGSVFVELNPIVGPAVAVTLILTAVDARRMDTGVVAEPEIGASLTVTAGSAPTQDLAA